MSRRGIPQKMFSDNFKMFKFQKVKCFIANLQINWRYIQSATHTWEVFMIV